MELNTVSKNYSAEQIKTVAFGFGATVVILAAIAMLASSVSLEEKRISQVRPTSESQSRVLSVRAPFANDCSPVQPGSTVADGQGGFYVYYETCQNYTGQSRIYHESAQDLKALR